MLYSEPDCIKPVIFSRLLNLSVSREPSKVICLAEQGRVIELAFRSESSIFTAKKYSGFMLITQAGKIKVSAHWTISDFGLEKKSRQSMHRLFCRQSMRSFCRVTLPLQEMTD